MDGAGNCSCIALPPESNCFPEVIYCQAGAHFMTSGGYLCFIGFIFLASASRNSKGKDCLAFFADTASGYEPYSKINFSLPLATVLMILRPGSIAGYFLRISLTDDCFDKTISCNVKLFSAGADDPSTARGGGSVAIGREPMRPSSTC